MANKFERFGKYILLEKLATGGMAEVFLCRKMGADGIGKFCAIKRILPQFADSPEFIDMFRDEAKIAINLNHSNIVSIHEFGVEKEQFFIVMDYVEGRNLRQILNKMKKGSSKFSIDQIVYIIKEVAAGLDHAHRCLDGSTGKPLNITHRDMSPQNVMVSFEGEIKIVDFGIAKAESQMETTRAGTLKGKFGYMSPEQAEGQPVDLRTDIFSLGIVLWELLANDRLFIANNEINTLRKIRDCQVPSLRKINPNIQAELDRITQKALARDRNLRYQTAAALHRDLSRFLNRQYPDFSPHDFSVFIKTIFADEILNTRKRVIEYAKIPFDGSGPSKPEAKASEVASDTIISGTQTSSYVSSKAPAPEEAQTQSGSEDGVPTGFKDNFNPSEDRRFAGFDVPDQSQPSLDVKSFSSVSAKQEAPADEPQEAGKIGILDENALAKELKRELNIKAPTPYALETEESSQADFTPMEHSQSGISQVGHGTQSSYSKTQWSRPSYRPPKRSSMNFVSIFVFCCMSLSTYALAVKFMTDTMRPIILVTEPVLGPLHRVLKVSKQADLPSNGPQNNTAKIPSSFDSQNGAAPDSQAQQPAYPPVQQTASSSKLPVGYTEMIISSAPSGAEIYIDGRNTMLLTPSKVPVPADRKFTLELRRSGYIDYTQENISKEEAGLKLTATLQKALIGYLDIDVRPPKDAKIYINGKLLKEERLPINRYPVPANTSLTIKAENPYQGWADQKVITVGPDRRTSVLLDLRSSSRRPSQR